MAGAGGWFLLTGLLVIAAARLDLAVPARRSGTATTSCSCSRLLVVITTFALKLTAGRAAMPFVLPVAARRDPGRRSCSTPRPRIVVTAVVAILAGGRQRPSLELGDVRPPRRHGRHPRRPARRAAAGVHPGRRRRCSSCRRVVVTAFSLLGERDLTGVAPARRGASALSAGGRGGRGGRQLRGARQRLRHPDRLPAAGARATRHSRSCAACSSRRRAPTTTR